MIGRLKNFLNSREIRKLTRNRAAMVALAVISTYLLIAVFIMCGAITRKSCDTIVGANKLPGFFATGTPEQRYEVATSKLLKMTQTALKQDDPASALKNVKLGRIRIVDQTPEEIQAIVDDANRIKDELNQSDNLDLDPEMMPKIESLESTVARLHAPMSFWDRLSHNASLFLGTDTQGRSILLRGLYSIKIAIQIGLVTATFSVILGALLGAAAGYFGGWVDHAVVWIYTTFSSIPNLVLLVVIAYAFTGFDLEERLLGLLGVPLEMKGPDSASSVANTVHWLFGGLDVKNSLLPVYIAFGATFWIGTCRVIRGETMKLKEMEYIHAARTAGFSSFHILLRHVIPNTAHLMLINFSLLLIGAIKSEVILSFLGLGVKGQPSWGIMIRDAGNNGDVVTGFFWEIGTATVLMFGLVLAFNILSDALQDAFDPKHV
jgi:peptide/nickel transport system permease protein